MCLESHAHTCVHAHRDAVGASNFPRSHSSAAVPRWTLEKRLRDTAQREQTDDFPHSNCNVLTDHVSLTHSGPRHATRMGSPSTALAHLDSLTLPRQRSLHDSSSTHTTRDVHTLSRHRSLPHSAKEHASTNTSAAKPARSGGDNRRHVNARDKLGVPRAASTLPAYLGAQARKHSKGQSESGNGSVDMWGNETLPSDLHKGFVLPSI